MNTLPQGSRVGHIDELDARLSNLLREVRLIVNLSDVEPSQILDIDSRGLAVLLGRVADDLRALWHLISPIPQPTYPCKRLSG